VSYLNGRAAFPPFGSNGLSSRAAALQHATADEYLVPEQVIGDAWHFQERARLPDVWVNLSSEQQQAVERLKAAIEAAPDGLEASPTLLDDPPWVLMRQRAADVLAAFDTLMV